MMESEKVDVIYVPTARDDLEMVVKCFFSRIDPVYSSIQSSTDVKELLQFWRYRLSTDFWINMINCAHNLDYHGLITHMNSILVS